MTITPLPVNLELSWTPELRDEPAPEPRPRQADEQETIICPLTGEEIPACCCPLND